MRRILVNPPALKDARSIGYNHGTIVDGTFYMAGQVAMDASGDIVGDDITTQANKAYDNIEVLLSAIGKKIGDVAKITTYIIDPKRHYYDGYKEVYWQRIAEPYPCHTVLGVDQLAHPEYLLEIEVQVPVTAADIDAIDPDHEAISIVE